MMGSTVCRKMWSFSQLSGYYEHTTKHSVTNAHPTCISGKHLLGGIATTDASVGCFQYQLRFKNLFSTWKCSETCPNFRHLGHEF